jgi:hypothetical protein
MPCRLAAQLRKETAAPQRWENREKGAAVEIGFAL